MLLRFLVLLQKLVVSGGQLAVEDVAVEGRDFSLSVGRLGHVC